MQYTVWSRGELIGTTELGFRSVGFDLCRSGHFLPNARGEKVMHELASDSHCMRAYFHRNYRDADGKDLLDPEYVNCDWFADVAEHLHESAHFALELRDEHNVVVPTSEIGIQDKHPDWPPPLSEEKLAEYKAAEAVRQAEYLEKLRASQEAFARTQPEPHPVSEHDRKMLEQMLMNDEEQMEGGDYTAWPCDITMPVGWGYDDHQGDNELGSGWNTTLRDLPDFPRYQVHVMLAET